MNRLLMAMIAILSLTFLSVNADSRVEPEVYGLSYDIKNESDMGLMVRFEASDPAQDPKHRTMVQEQVDVPMHDQKSNDIESFGIGPGYYGPGTYEVYLYDGHQVDQGLIGPGSNLSVYRKKVAPYREVYYILESTYDKATKTAKFKLILKNNQKEEL